MKDQATLDKIIKRYFSDSGSSIKLKKAQILLDQYETNRRIFYVKKGTICGFLPDKNLAEPVFEAHSGSFVGVYSFFSENHSSYTRVVATTEAEVVFYDGNPYELPSGEAKELLTFLNSVVIDELRERQHFAGKMAHGREQTLHKLIQSEKLATLGQLSAGVAHELNNAIASLTGDINRIESILQQLLRNQLPQHIPTFEQGRKEGQTLSSSDARTRRAKIEKIKSLKKETIKLLAKTNIPIDHIRQLAKQKENLESLATSWEAGQLLHDMNLAITQATHVIQSVKSAGLSNQRWVKNADINQTISEALAILKNLTKTIEISVELSSTLPSTEACPGELIQVWINLIKNGIESLTHSRTPNPTVKVTSRALKRRLEISITDNGPGIPKNLYEQVFQPNFTTKVDGLSFGLGLGLTIVKRIVDEHNGTIKLESEQGKTTFAVYLPIIN